jgi:hypothetical protein
MESKILQKKYKVIVGIFVTAFSISSIAAEESLYKCAEGIGSYWPNYTPIRTSSTGSSNKPKRFLITKTRNTIPATLQGFYITETNNSPTKKYFCPFDFTRFIGQPREISYLTLNIANEPSFYAQFRPPEVIRYFSSDATNEEFKITTRNDSTIIYAGIPIRSTSVACREDNSIPDLNLIKERLKETLDPMIEGVFGSQRQGTAKIELTMENISKVLDLKRALGDCRGVGIIPDSVINGLLQRLPEIPKEYQPSIGPLRSK